MFLPIVVQRGHGGELRLLENSIFASRYREFMKVFISNTAIAQILALLAARASLDAGQELRLLAPCLAVWDVFLFVVWLNMGSRVRQVAVLKFLFSIWGAWITAVFLSIAVTLMLNVQAGAY